MNDTLSLLTFEEADHVYRFDGRVVPSVTQIMKPITKLWTSGETLEWARQQGQAVHQMIEWELKGTLDEEGLPDWLKPILADWRLFIEQTGFELIASEPRLYHPAYGYAGTPDLIGMMHNIHKGKRCVIDIKRTIPKTVGVQTAGYRAAWNHSHPLPHERIDKRFALSLNPYRLVECADAGDWNVFLSLLTLRNYMEKT